MNTQLVYSKFATFINKLRRNEVRYPWLAYPKIALTVIIVFGVINMLIKPKITLLDVGFLLIAVVLHLLLNYIYREFPKFYPLLEGKLVPQTGSLAQWFEHQTAATFANWQGYLVGVTVSVLFLFLFDFNQFAINYLSPQYLSPVPATPVIAFTLYALLIFFIAGVGIFMYLQLLGLVVKLNKFRISKSAPVFFDQEVDQLSAAFVRFILGGLILALFVIAVSSVFALSIETLVIVVPIFNIYLNGLSVVPYWTICFGSPIMLYFMAFQYLLHNLLVKFQQHNVAHVSDQLCAVYSAWSGRLTGDKPEDVAKLIQWRDELQQRSEWARIINRCRQASFRTVLNVVILVIAVSLMIVALSGVNKEMISIEPFQIPKELQEKGYTGQMIAAQLIDQLQDIAQKGASWGASQQILTGAWTQNEVQIQVPGVGISLNAIQQLLRQLVGKEPHFISGEIIVSDSAGNLKLTLRVSGEPALEIQGNTGDLHKVLRQAAQYVSRHTQPQSLAVVKLFSENDADGCIEVLRGISQPTAAEYYLWGHALGEQERYDEAIGKYKQALAKDPFFFLPYVEWGNALVEQNKYPEAIMKFRKAIELFSNYSYGYVLWGNALARQQKYEEANAKLQKALAIYPNNAYTFVTWGDALLRQQKYAEARKNYQKAIELQPDWYEISRRYAWRLATAPDDKFRDGAQALSLAQKALELFHEGGDNNITILDTIAAAYAESGQFEEAVKTLENIRPEQKLTKKQAAHLARYKNHQPVREEF